jgi:tetratricopeptide (TPR) repeat protein
MADDKKNTANSSSGDCTRRVVDSELLAVLKSVAAPGATVSLKNNFGLSLAISFLLIVLALFVLGARFYVFSNIDSNLTLVKNAYAESRQFASDLLSYDIFQKTKTIFQKTDKNLPDSLSDEFPAIEIIGLKQKEALQRDRLSAMFLELKNSLDAGDFALVFLRSEEIGRYIEILQKEERNDYELELAAALSMYHFAKYAIDNDKKDEAAQLQNAEYAKQLTLAIGQLNAANSVLNLENNILTINEAELKALREKNIEAEELLARANANIENDINERWKMLARGLERSGYRDAITDAKEILLAALRIRSRDTRVEYLKNARSRWEHDEYMSDFIGFLLERL